MIDKDWEPFFKGWTLTKTVEIQRHYLNEILNHTSPDDQLLEIGAGSGFSSLALFYSGRKNVVVSDNNPIRLERMRTDFPCLKVEQIDMFHINREDKSVDCIFHQGLMEHFTDEEIIASLREQGRVAKQVIFDVPNNKRWKKVQEFGDERFLPVGKWVRLIEKSGLQVSKITGRRLPFLQNNELIKRTFGTASIFVCAT